MASRATAAVLCALCLLLGGTKADEPDSAAIESMLQEADKMALADATVLFAGSVASVYEGWTSSSLLVTKWLLLRVPCITGTKHYIFARTDGPHVASTSAAHYTVSYHYNYILNVSLEGTLWMESQHYMYNCHSIYGAACDPYVRTFYKEIPTYIDVAQVNKGDIVVEQLNSNGNPLRPARGSIGRTDIASDSTGSRVSGQQNDILHANSRPTALLMTRWIIFRLTSVTGVKHYLFTRTEGIVHYYNETAPAVMAEFTIAVKGRGPIWMASAKHELCSHDDFTNDVCIGKEFIKESDAEIPDYVDMSRIGKEDIIVDHIVI